LDDLVSNGVVPLLINRRGTALFITVKA